MTSVLLLGDYRQSLTIARSLRSRGDRVVAMVSPGGESYLRHCRGVDDLWHTEQSISDDGFDRSLAEAVSTFEVDVVFPVGDGELAWFAEDPDRIGVPVAAPDVGTIRQCHDKQSLLALCTSLGIAHSEGAEVTGLDQLEAVVDELGFPAIIKPSDPLKRLLKAKAIICRSADDLDRHLASWPDDHDALIVQRYVDGPRHNLYFAAERGQVRGLAEVEILRTDTPDDTGYAVDGVTVEPNPTLVAATEALAKELKYQGVGCTQFLVSPDGETSFLELNPRLGANFAVVDRAGLNLVHVAVDSALGRPIPPLSSRTGVRYAWTTGDFEGLVRAFRDRTIGPRQAVLWVRRLVATALRARVHITWSWRDPMPTLAILWRATIRRGLGRIVGRFTRSRG